MTTYFSFTSALRFARNDGLIVAALLLSSCTAHTANDFTKLANRQAAAIGMQAETISAPPFHLASWYKIKKPGEPITIYIEGDGNAWASRSQPSLNPTPAEATALSLAALDPSPNVAYLARPCQYAQALTDQVCNENNSYRYWTLGRFSNEVVKASSYAISHLKKLAKAKQVDLVGYSGGGAVAVIVTAMREDVRSLRTVSGLIDVGAQAAALDLTPLRDSYDPADFAYQIRNIPQIHFVGGVDEIVPPIVAGEYQKKAKNSQCVHIELIPKQDHFGTWADRWAELVKRKPVCL